jgi:hypothetical protein
MNVKPGTLRKNTSCVRLYISKAYLPYYTKDFSGLNL